MDKEEMIKLVKNRIDNDEEIIKVENNKNNEFVVVVKWETNNDLWFKLYNDNKYNAVNTHPRIMARKVDGNSIFIEDIQVEDINVGNGTILLNSLIEHCKHNKYSSINGKISNIDFNHIDRLKHFYTKFNFEIKLGKCSGSILYKF